MGGGEAGGRRLFTQGLLGPELNELVESGPSRSGQGQTVWGQKDKKGIHSKCCGSLQEDSRGEWSRPILYTERKYEVDRDLSSCSLEKGLEKWGCLWI